jgi:hypothetical protein
MHVPTLQANLVPTLTHPMFSFVILNEIRGVCFQGAIVITTNNINHTMHLPSTLVGIATMTKFKSSNTYAGIAITQTNTQTFFWALQQKNGKKTPPSFHMDTKGGVKLYQACIDLHNKTTWP